MNQLLVVSNNLGLSAVGIGIALMLGFSQGNLVADTDSKLAVGVAFTASCAFGLSIAVRPGWYRRKGRQGQHFSQDEGAQRSMKGHHPDCTAFDRHRVDIGGNVFCAGCIGIAIGSILAIVLMAIYVATGQGTVKGSAQLLVVLGSSAIIFAYAEAAQAKRNVTLHVALSAALILGFLSITIGLLESSGIAIVGLMGVLFSFLWTNTRISLSNWRHALLCRKCSELCKSY